MHDPTSPYLSYMHLALEEAKKAYAADEVPIGCIIVDSRTSQIVARTHNLMKHQHNPTAHAELLAIQQASALLGTERLTTCDLFVTLEPCPMCAQAISFARIQRLYYAASDPKGGGVEHGAKIFASSSCHFKPEIYIGFYENESANLLREFFKNKR